MAQLGAVMEKREVPPSPGVSSASGGPRSTAPLSAPAASTPAENGQKTKATRKASGAGAVTGILGVVCALLGVLAAPSLFLPLAVAFSVFAIVRSLVAFSFAGMIAATLSCIFTVVGLVLFPWGTYQGSKAASSSTAAVIQSQNSAAPDKEIQPEPPKAAEPNAGALSLPPAAPEQAARPAKPEEEPRSATSESGPPASVEPRTKLEEALPTPPPPAAAVVPDRATPPVAAAPPKPAVAEPPKPVLAEPPKSEAAEPPKPIVAPEPPRPITAEPPKVAAAPEPLKPAAEPPKAAAAAAADAKANLQAWPENRTDQTRVIQILLRDLNFYHGTTNGTFGPGTRAAICLYLVTYDEKGECEPTKALFDSLQKRKASPNVGNAPR